MPFFDSPLGASMASDISWGNTPDRAARTKAAREALEQKFLDQADGDPKRAASIRSAYYKRIAMKSVQARQARQEAVSAEPDVDTAPDHELSDLAGDAA
jgi:hypothetical protein